MSNPLQSSIRFSTAAVLMTAVLSMTACGSTTDGGDSPADPQVVEPDQSNVISACGVAPDQAERRAAAGLPAGCTTGTGSSAGDPGRPSSGRPTGSCYLAPSPQQRDPDSCVR